MRTIGEKILSLDHLEKILDGYRANGEKIVLCHGVFDLMHPGHILYFQAAKKHGHILVVTITPDQHVNKGPGRPVFNEHLRAESIAALECVDFVAINEWPTAEKTIRKLRPNVYAKGQDYRNAASDVTGEIKNEAAAVRAVGGKIVFTDEEVFSSSTLINRFFAKYPVATQHYLHEFRKKYSSDELHAKLKDISKLRVLIVGEAILDQYSYCHPMAKSPKETIVASRFLSEENFAGGAVAIANHVAGFCGQVTLVTNIGRDPKARDFFKSKLNSKIRLQSPAGTLVPPITKRRYVEPNFLTKMFEIQYLNDAPYGEDEEKKILDMLSKQIAQHDLVMVADYGHGLITDKIRDFIMKKSRFLCVNTQTNSANYGFNLATKYRQADFVCIDEAEMKLALHSRYGEVPKMAAQLRHQIKADVLLVSRGPNGSVVSDRKGRLHETPIVSSRVVDRTGAGDALLAITSPCVYQKFPADVVGFFGSCAGAIAVEIVCNREPISPIVFSKFITGLLK